MSFHIIKWTPLFERQFRFYLWSRWLNNLSVQFTCRYCTSNSWSSGRVQCPDTRGNILHFLLCFHRHSEIVKIGSRRIFHSAATTQTMISFQIEIDQSESRIYEFENLPTWLPIWNPPFIWIIYQRTKFFRFIHSVRMLSIGFTGRSVHGRPVYFCKRLWTYKLCFCAYIW